MSTTVMDQSVLELMRQMFFVGFNCLHCHIDTYSLCLCNFLLSDSCFEAFKEYALQKNETDKKKPEYTEDSYSISYAVYLLKLGLNGENEENETMIQESADEFKRFSERASKIYESIIKSALLMAEVKGFLLKVIEKTEIIDKRFGRPDSVPKPFHLHYTTNESGGGNLEQIFDTFKSYDFTEFHVPNSWIKRSNETRRKYLSLSSIDPTKALEMIDKGRFEDACFHAIKTAKIIQAVGLEAAEIFLEMTSWRLLPCAMAFHNRLGRDSQLGLLSQDTLQMVLRFF